MLRVFQHDYMYQRYRKYKFDCATSSASGSEAREKEPLEEEIVDYFGSLEDAASSFTLSNPKKTAGD